jgi:transcriptional repressor of cell division inhibition gene dicB
MKKSDVVNFFGGVTKTAVALGLTKSAVSKWPDELPPLRALQVEEVTGGNLKADRSRIFGPKEAA